MSAPDIHVPQYLRSACTGDAMREEWLVSLPDVVRDLSRKWRLALSPPFEQGASCSWVCPCMRQDGQAAVLKIGMPHMEGLGEIDGLLFWDGDPTVCIYESDRTLNAMLLERCVPGTSLRELPECEQDAIVARMLRRLWKKPPADSAFRPLSGMIAEWNREARAALPSFPDPGLAEEGMQVREELAAGHDNEVLLATDLHAGNILRAERASWLVIDPKPFAGDAAYDATQHLLNCTGRLRMDPLITIDTFADLLEIERRRLRLWMFGRLATEFGGRYQELARAVEKTLSS